MGRVRRGEIEALREELRVLREEVLRLHRHTHQRIDAVVSRTADNMGKNEALLDELGRWHETARTLLDRIGPRSGGPS